MSERDQKEVGTFEVASGIIVVSDPCYDMDTWCRGNIDNVKNGKWTATIETSNEGAWGNRVAALIIKHADHKSADADRQEKLNADIGVDSGQCGFYDLPIFREKNNVPADAKLASYIDEEDGKWYSMCCAATYGDHGRDAGIIPGGVVSSSGFGDGSYECFVDKDENGQVTGATLIFIGEDEEEEDEEDDK